MSTEALTSIHGRKLGLRTDGSLQTEGGSLKVPAYATTDLPDAADLEGSIVYDITSGSMKASDGDGWVELSAGGGATVDFATVSALTGDWRGEGSETLLAALTALQGG